MNQSKITAERLLRKAIIYIRQSSPNQVLHHQESQRRQYGLVDRARDLGFQQVIVIDEDLGRTGSGFVERPGFQRLVAEVCSGRSEEHTSELQSQSNLVCRLLLEKKKTQTASSTHVVVYTRN